MFKLLKMLFTPPKEQIKTQTNPPVVRRKPIAYEAPKRVTKSKPYAFYTPGKEWVYDYPKTREEISELLAPHKEAGKIHGSNARKANKLLEKFFDERVEYEPTIEQVTKWLAAAKADNKQAEILIDKIEFETEAGHDMGDRVLAKISDAEYELDAVVEELRIEFADRRDTNNES